MLLNKKEKTMFKKSILSLSLCAFLFSNVNAISLDNVLNSTLGGLDKRFNNLFSNSLSAYETCYGKNFDINVDFDVCKIASKLDNLKMDSCKLIGGHGGQQIGISGVQSFCNDKMRKFEDYVSKQASDFVEYQALNIDSNNKISEFAGKLPNGQDLKSYFKTWDVNSVLNDNSPNNIVGSYLKQGNQEVVSLIMDYAKSAGAKTLPNQIQLEDIKAPATLENYQSGINESVRNYKKILQEISPNSISTLVRSKLSGNTNDAKAANDIVSENKKAFDLAKSIEIGQALSNSNRKFAIPTQEYVSNLRSDLQLKAIAEIRKQQAEEVALISKIEDKWNKKYEIAKLLADKEVILAQQFDSKAAQDEIDNIVANANSKPNTP